MAFTIPLQSMVIEHIKGKKQWPERFIEYYADKFWNHYQSSGWKLSNGNAMKDWKAAFNSNWQVPKFKEDIDYLNECKKKQMPVGQELTGNEVQDTINYLDELLRQYRARFESVPTERLSSCYDWLKAQRLIKLSKEEITLIKEAYANDTLRGKAACVKILFDKMITHGVTFNSLTKQKA